MQRQLVLGSGESMRLPLSFHARAIRIDNPGQHSIQVQPYGWTVQPGRVQVSQNFQSGTTIAHVVSTPVVPGATTEPAVITYYDAPLSSDPGQLLAEPTSVPSAPVVVSSASLDSSAAITWLPVTANPPVTSYTVRLNHQPIANVNASTTSYTIGGLTNLVTYTLTVSATNGEGEGPSKGFFPVTPVAAKPWTPIVEATQVGGNLAGAVADVHPVGTSPTWIVGPGATYTKIIGTGIELTAGVSNYALIDPQGVGDRTISTGFFSAAGDQVYVFLINDGASNSYLAAVWLAVVGIPCLGIYQKFAGGTASLVALLGGNYTNATWNVLMEAQIRGNVLTISLQAASGTSGLSVLPTPVTFFNPLEQFRYFGFELFNIGAGQAIQSIGFTSP